jgi:hypothetical protein
MSVKALNLIRAHRLGGVYRKAVMYVLADYAGADGSTYVGQRRLAAEAEVSERKARSILADFEREGLIRRQHRHRGRGRTSDRIFLDYQALERLPMSLPDLAAPHAATSSSVMRHDVTDLAAPSVAFTGTSYAREPLGEPEGTAPRNGTHREGRPIEEGRPIPLERGLDGKYAFVPTVLDPRRVSDSPDEAAMSRVAGMSVSEEMSLIFDVEERHAVG